MYVVKSKEAASGKYTLGKCILVRADLRTERVSHYLSPFAGLDWGWCHIAYDAGIEIQLIRPK